jgi:hypothetical protein
VAKMSRYVCCRSGVASCKSDRVATAYAGCMRRSGMGPKLQAAEFVGGVLVLVELESVVGDRVAVRAVERASVAAGAD